MRYSVPKWLFFPLIIVGSGFHCLRSIFFFFFQCFTPTPSFISALLLASSLLPCYLLSLKAFHSSSLSSNPCWRADQACLSVVQTETSYQIKGRANCNNYHLHLLRPTFFACGLSCQYHRKPSTLFYSNNIPKLLQKTKHNVTSKQRQRRIV